MTKLKQQPGQAILIYGAGPVAHTLIQHGLVDELRVHLYPLLAGGKVRLLNDASDLPAMKLVDIKVFASGIVILTYQPTRPG